MAKRQKTLQNDYFRSTCDQVVFENEQWYKEQAKLAKEASKAADPLQAARKLWKDSYYTDFQWIEFNSDNGRVFCKTCRSKDGRSVYAKAGSINIKVSAFQDHIRSEEHKRLRWVELNGVRRMEQQVKKASEACNEALLSLMRAACYVDTSLTPFARFPELYKLLVSVKACITESLYHDEKSCSGMILCISSIMQKSILNRVRDAKFFGIMIDESTDVSVTGHLVVFATFVEDGEVACVFLGLLGIKDGKKDVALIFETY
jgi:hypothetical protein